MNPSSVSPYAFPALPRLLSTLLFNASLLAAIGVAASYLLVLRPSSRGADRADGLALQVRMRAILAIVGAALIVTSYLSFAAGIARAEPTPDYAAALSPVTMAHFIAVPADSGDWISAGLQELIQYGLLVLGGVALLAGRSRRVAGAGVAAGLVLALLGTAVSELPTTTDALTGDDLAQTLLIQVHIAAAGLWVGGLSGLAVLAGLERRRTGTMAPIWSRIWPSFSQVAAVGVGGVLISGLWLTWQHVGSPAQFLTTPYGRFLGFKIIIVLIMIAAGGYNQLVLLPRLAKVGASHGAGAAVSHLGKVVRIEALLGGVVILIVSFLSGSARREAGGDPASPIDGRILALGLLLILLIAFGLWSAGRLAKSFGRTVEPVDPNQPV